MNGPDVSNLGRLCGLKDGMIRLGIVSQDGVDSGDELRFSSVSRCNVKINRSSAVLKQGKMPKVWRGW